MLQRLLLCWLSDGCWGTNKQRDCKSETIEVSNKDFKISLNTGTPSSPKCLLYRVDEKKINCCHQTNVHTIFLIWTSIAVNWRNYCIIFHSWKHLKQILLWPHNLQSCLTLGCLFIKANNVIISAGLSKHCQRVGTGSHSQRWRTALDKQFTQTSSMTWRLIAFTGNRFYN